MNVKYIYIYIIAFSYRAHLYIDVHYSNEAKKKKIFYFVFTLLFYFLFFLAFILLSPCLFPHCLSISSFFLHRPFFLPQRPIANLHKPSRHRPITIDPRSAADLTHFGLSSLFLVFRAVLVFWLCVLGCAYVSALCFGL